MIDAYIDNGVLFYRWIDMYIAGCQVTLNYLVATDHPDKKFMDIVHNILIAWEYFR